MIVKARITANFKGRGYKPLALTSVSAYSVDSALDTDTDSWNLSIGDLDFKLLDMLDFDLDDPSEVRVNIYAVGEKQTMALNTGFADQITLDHSNVYTITGRDLTSVAVDSQHPPQIWKNIRPHALVANEARKLKIGGSLNLTQAKGFKSYSTDGSESFWQVWYRFYRKRKLWLYAEADGTIIAGGLNFTEAPAYYFGSPQGVNSARRGQVWVPVLEMEYRVDKTQRVGEITIFGHNHHGKVGFVHSEKDKSIAKWIRRPNRILESSDVHNAAEARIEALEEIYESKVGSVEIKLTVADPGFVFQQNKIAMVNLPSVGLRGEFFVVGNTTIGSVTEGFYQVIRLRQKKYAISKRVPAGPQLSAGPDASSTKADIASGLSIGAGDVNWKQYYVDAATKFHGPWPFQLFLGVLLSISQQESNFTNVREGGTSNPYPGHYPGVADGEIPKNTGTSSITLQDSSMLSNWDKFSRAFANDVNNPGNPWFGSREAGVGPMQLTTKGYKLYADRLDGSNVGDELLGGRWNPQWNIMAGGAVLASKLGAGVSISPEGQIRSVPISGPSLQPTEENIWTGVAAYNGSGAAAQAYADLIRSIYTNNYKGNVASAITSAAQKAKKDDVILSNKSSTALQTAVLNNSLITFSRSSQKTDIQSGQIDDRVLKFLLAFTEEGYPAVTTALKSDHSHLGKASAHAWGLAVDIGNYDTSNPSTDAAMIWIEQHRDILGFAQLIGPNPSLVYPENFYDAETLAEHKTHIHVGWPCPECPKYRSS